MNVLWLNLNLFDSFFCKVIFIIYKSPQRRSRTKIRPFRDRRPQWSIGQFQAQRGAGQFDQHYSALHESHQTGRRSICRRVRGYRLLGQPEHLRQGLLGALPEHREGRRRRREFVGKFEKPTRGRSIQDWVRQSGETNQSIAGRSVWRTGR